MTTREKERLHRLVEQIPDWFVGAAEAVLVALSTAPRPVGQPSGDAPDETLDMTDPVLRALFAAPEDDEPDDDDIDGGLSEAREEARRGESIPHEEVKRRLGL